MLSKFRKRDGYVMLAVISVCVLMITLLSVLANLSLRRGLEAADAERALQQRWGARTLERTLLTQAPALFESREETASVKSPGEPPEPVFRTAVTLGEVTFDLLLGDEDAKVNLNSLYHHGGVMTLTQSAGSLLDARAANSMRLLPALEPQLAGDRPDSGNADELESDPLPAFRSWGEVFDVAALQTEWGSTAALPNITTRITCWGSGQLNFRRASDSAILAVAAPVIQDGAAKRLLDRYRESPTARLAILLQTELSDQRDRDRISRLLSETSSNFSLWIDASTKGRKPLRSFTVQSRDPEGDLRYHHFQF